MAPGSRVARCAAAAPDGVAAARHDGHSVRPEKIHGTPRTHPPSAVLADRLRPVVGLKKNTESTATTAACGARRNHAAVSAGNGPKANSVRQRRHVLPVLSRPAFGSSTRRQRGPASAGPVVISP